MSIVESSASACWIGPCFFVHWDRWVSVSKNRGAAGLGRRRPEIYGGAKISVGNIWESHFLSHGKTGKIIMVRWKTWLQISSNHYPVTLVAWVLTFSEYYLREFALAALSHRFKDSCMGVKIYPRRAISRLNSGFRGTYVFQTTYGVKVRSFRAMWKIAGQGCHGHGLPVAWFS